MKIKCFHCDNPATQIPRIKRRLLTAVDHHDAKVEISLRGANIHNISLITQRAMTKTCDHHLDLCCCDNPDCREAAAAAAKKRGANSVMFIVISPVLLKALED